MSKSVKITINGIEYVPAQPDKLSEFNTYLAEAAKENLPYVICRTYSAGVHAGFLESRNGKEGVLLDSRRLYHWSGAATLSELAMHGVKHPAECQFPCPVKKITLTEIIEVLPCTEKARKSIEEVPIWSA